MTRAEVDDAVEAKRVEVADELDAWIVEQMRELVLTAGGLTSHPRVSGIINEHRKRLERLRDAQLTVLESPLLREVGKLH
jgi:hypothetical protein